MFDHEPKSDFPGSYFQLARAAVIAVVRIIMLVSAALALLGPAHARNSSAAGSGVATVVEPLTVKAIRPLEFSIEARTIRERYRYVIRADRSIGVGSYNEAKKPRSPAFTGTPAEFEVRGIPHRYYRVGLPTRVTAHSSGIRTNTIDVTELFAESRNSTSTPGEFRLGANGVDRFQVGGELEITAQTAVAKYTAEITLAVRYD
ncbi:DUF4402 domain-containing protein [Erythrobacter rubeus]|uniref:DUF4402 domain-containing protein n=1 Tax=Erythrobacter rubeus TaxID=2760803 RepID=A0ABR8KK73_9SPHN|nr:DUF4402 domain-containing protein [Erythrobacter rubeus]MBD2840638.1 DUF4402 domain-containing protein [Erythrobacter rubeus]